jgi:PAS domain S-box-containing protein/putative nucleotidyltransferase with HDIG domain
MLKDITERKQADEVIEILSVFPEENPNPVMHISSQGEILYANRAAVTILNTWKKKVGQVLPMPIKEDVLNTLQDKQNLDIKLTCGKKIFLVTLAPNIEEKYINFYGRDISESKQMEEALRASEEKYRTLVEQSIDGITISDEQGNTALWNKSMESITGLNACDTIGVPLWKVQAQLIPDEIKTPELLEQLRAGVEIIFNSKNDWRGGSRVQTIICADGKRKTVQDSTFIIKTNNTVRLGTILRDITERKVAEEALRSKQMMLARTEGIAHIGSWAWNIATDKVTWSDELFSIFQRDPQEGAPSFSEQPALYYPEDMARLRQAVEGAVTDGTSYELELRAIRKDGETRVCVARGIPEMELGGRVVSLFGSLQDITEQKQNQNELQNLIFKLRETVEGTIATIALIVEARDPYTSGHQQRVANISVKIAEDLGLPEEQIRGVYMAGLIHDLGKIHVPAEILSKPGELTKLEFDMIKTHPKVGYDLLKRIEFPWPIAQIIYQHHEREDGSGYPRKLKGDKILIEAKIIGIADVIEAMSSHRPYRPALGMNIAIDEIVKHKGILYDTTIVASYLKVIKKGYTQKNQFKQFG